MKIHNEAQQNVASAKIFTVQPTGDDARLHAKRTSPGVNRRCAISCRLFSARCHMRDRRRHLTRDAMPARARFAHSCMLNPRAEFAKVNAYGYISEQITPA
jgi:hypothetical protein